MVSKSVREAADETRADLTPMIDVTFLLLIFFVCSIKFKVLEGKLQTFLPKDAGVIDTPLDTLLEKVDIKITRTGAHTHEALGLSNIEQFRAWKERGWRIDEVHISVQGERMTSLDHLSNKLQELRKATPAPENPNGQDGILGTPDDEPDSLKMNIEAMAGVLYEDVVKIVDVAIGAGFTSITFRGIEADA